MLKRSSEPGHSNCCVTGYGCVAWSTVLALWLPQIQSTQAHRSRVAEWLGNWASNQKVAGSIPSLAKWFCVLGQVTSPYLRPCTYCKSLWIRASEKWLNVNVQCLMYTAARFTYHCRSHNRSAFRINRCLFPSNTVSSHLLWWHWVVVCFWLAICSPEWQRHRKPICRVA